MSLSTAEQVREHLKEKEVQQRNPNPDDLRQLCEYVKTAPLRKSTIGTSDVTGNIKNDDTHPFCQRAEEATREVATYLLYLFSYNRAGMVDGWMSSLERAITTCDECARGFCVARRTFIAK
jgi:senataxin